MSVLKDKFYRRLLIIAILGACSVPAAVASESTDERGHAIDKDVLVQSQPCKTPNPLVLQGQPARSR